MIDVMALRGAIVTEYKTVDAFCKAAGVPRASLDNLLRGRHNPSYEQMAKIYKALQRPTVEQKFRIFFADELA